MRYAVWIEIEEQDEENDTYTDMSTRLDFGSIGFNTLAEAEDFAGMLHEHAQNVISLIQPEEAI